MVGELAKARAYRRQLGAQLFHLRRERPRGGTLRQGIERKLKQRIPQIKGISSPQLLPLA